MPTDHSVPNPQRVIRVNRKMIMLYYVCDLEQYVLYCGHRRLQQASLDNIIPFFFVLQNDELT